MKLSDYIDIGKLRIALEKEAPRTYLFHLADTAKDAAPTRSKGIGNLYVAYTECSDLELTTDKLLSYIEGLMLELGDDDSRRRFLQAIDPTAMKWDRWRRTDQ